jgi:L-rhamnose isomerase/sugar isomerase
VLGANRVLVDAFSTDVRPLCARVREQLGASADPIGAFRANGYTEQAAETRVGKAAAWL